MELQGAVLATPPTSMKLVVQETAGHVEQRAVTCIVRYALPYAFLPSHSYKAVSSRERESVWLCRRLLGTLS
jgi:hypothetical protein